MLLLLYMDFFICLIKKSKGEMQPHSKSPFEGEAGFNNWILFNKNSNLNGRYPSAYLYRVYIKDPFFAVDSGCVTSFLFLFSSIQLDMNVFSYSSPLKWPTVLFFLKTNREGNKSIKFFRTWNKKKNDFHCRHWGKDEILLWVMQTSQLSF